MVVNVLFLPSGLLNWAQYNLELDVKLGVAMFDTTREPDEKLVG